jgi:hypothetical protein
MTDNIKEKMKMVEAERNAGNIELEKLKDAYAKYIIEDADKIKNDISHPYVVTKKDVRMKRMKDFFNKFKKAIGL